MTKPGILELKWPCVVIWIALSAVVQGQDGIDTSILRQWVDSARSMIGSDPDEARRLSDLVVEESDPKYYYGLVNGLQVIGETYYGASRFDSANHYYKRALDESRKRDDLYENGNNLTSLASIFLSAGELDSSLIYYQNAIRAFELRNDTSALCDAFLRFGNAQSQKGNHDEALGSFMRSLRMCDALNREIYVAYNYGSIGIIHDKQGNYDNAEEYFLKALDLFTQLGDLYGQMGVSNNLGILYKNQQRYEESMDAYARCLVYADSADLDQGRLSAHTNLGILNVQLQRFENALQHSNLGIQYARDLNAKEALADNLNTIARAHLGLRDFAGALKYGEEALLLGTEVGSLEKQRDANLTLSEITEGLSAFDRSLVYYKNYTAIKDSLLNAEKSKQISELQTIYETEKKDKEIQLLAKSVEIDRMRKARLWIAFGFTLVVGMLLLYAQRIRRIRDRKILEKENELEVQKRRTVELERSKLSRELDFKRQELAAKALQLARKNEFLQSLNTEMDTLRSGASAPVDTSVRRISRRIRKDIESEEEWEQFLVSFREVHHDFIENLLSTYPTITKSELRLACLMKMNLSGKEIAAMLNITQEGVKKARYRLRKKLGVESDVDIQQFLLGLSQAAQ